MKNEYHHRARRTDAADIWHFIRRYFRNAVLAGVSPRPPSWDSSMISENSKKSRDKKQGSL